VSLCRAHHLGIDNVYFNCNRAADFAMADGLTKLGIENVPAVATRGVVLFHTGWLRLLGKDNGRFGSAGPGLGIDGAVQAIVNRIAIRQHGRGS